MMASRWRRWGDKSMDDILSNSLRYETHDHLMGVPTGEGVGRSRDWKKFLCPVRLPNRAGLEIEDRDNDGNSADGRSKRGRARGRGRGLELKRGPLRKPGLIANRLVGVETGSASESSRSGGPMQYTGDEIKGLEITLVTTNASTEKTVDQRKTDACELNTDTSARVNTVSDEFMSCEFDSKVRTEDSISRSQHDVPPLHGNVFAQQPENATMPADNKRSSPVGDEEPDDEEADCKQTALYSDDLMSHFSKIEFLEDMREKIAANDSALTVEVQKKLIPGDQFVSDNTTVAVENLPSDINEMDLLDVLSAFGDVCQFSLDRDDNKIRALVKLSSVESCEWIISALDGTPYPGCSDDLVVTMALCEADRMQ